MNRWQIIRYAMSCCFWGIEVPRKGHIDDVLLCDGIKFGCRPKFQFNRRIIKIIDADGRNASKVQSLGNSMPMMAIEYCPGRPICDQWFGKSVPLQRHFEELLHISGLDFLVSLEPLHGNQPHIVFTPRHACANRIYGIMLCLVRAPEDKCRV